MELNKSHTSFNMLIELSYQLHSLQKYAFKKLAAKVTKANLSTEQHVIGIKSYIVHGSRLGYR